MKLDKALLLSECYKIMHEVKGRHFPCVSFPVVLKVSTEKAFCNKFAAMWTLKEFDGYPVHEIKLSYFLAMDKKYLTETLVHELCHAQQYQEGIENTPHNRAFFSRLDYVLAKLGLPATDKEYRHAIKKY